jgi:hypothetical protein
MEEQPPVVLMTSIDTLAALVWEKKTKSFTKNFGQDVACWRRVTAFTMMGLHV